MLDLEVYDIVRIERDDGSVYLESVNAKHINDIDPQASKVITDHFNIKYSTLEITSILDGTGEDDEYTITNVWRLDENGNYMLVWENTKSIEDKTPRHHVDGLKGEAIYGYIKKEPIEENDKKPCPIDRPSDVDYDTHSKVCKERDELKEIVVEQVKEIYNLKQKLF